jgi:UDPglucose 6-dehydrogenase
LSAPRTLRCSVVGLGKLGASMAAAIASRGHGVVGVDVEAEAVARLARRVAPVVEPDVGERLAAAPGRVDATTDAADAVAATDVTFLVVPTPSDERGAFSIAHVVRAAQAIGRGLARKDGYHLVVVTSTVLPGATRYGVLPVLERSSGRRCGVDFGLCYSPAFIALGSVVRDFLNPDFVLVGEHDARAGETLEQLYADILERAAPVRRMTLENAELAKLAVNTYVTTKITFANMLADLCERIPGGDVDVVSDALGLDRRIGRSYLTGALGYGGPCFPRDNVALGFLARAAGTRASLAEATDAANRALAAETVERLRPLIAEGATVAVLGLAYKPATPVVDESQGVLLARALAAAGAHVVAHDPLANEAARAVLGDAVEVTDDLVAALGRADAVLITTPDPVYRALTPGSFNGKPRPVVVVDFWRILRDRLSADDHIHYVATGRSRDDAANAARLAALWAPDDAAALPQSELAAE